ncbi:MAG: type II toxin-antitoxin system RelE/ParE family toxin [Treponema sp.]|nr:type II toxin-antitoxin system RelE/ParE family toxin [Treponema sp.]
MRVFKNTWFARFAAKEGIVDSELKAIVNDVLEAGQAEASLGGGVYKARLARPGEGKSGGYRVIVLFRSGERTFYVYGFAKSARANISEKDLKRFKEMAKENIGMTDEQLKNRIKAGHWNEIN